MEYGARRAYQDFGNSKAKTLRDAGETADPDAIFSERHAMFVSGEFNTRGTGSGETFSDMENMVYDIAAEARAMPGWSELQTTWTGCKGMTTDERKRAMLDCVESLDKKRRGKIESAAKDRLESLAALAI